MQQQELDFLSKLTDVEKENKTLKNDLQSIENNLQNKEMALDLKEKVS